PGAEYVSQTALLALWNELETAFRDAIAAHEGSVQEWLAARNPTWNLVGRVCFHLAEHKDDPEYPFAFLATYTTRLGRLAKVTHTPLRRTVELSSASGDRSALVSLLVPVRRAAEK